MTFHELLKVFCFQYKICSLEYFLDLMQSCEINTYIEYLKFTDISSWERCRLLMYSIVLVNSKKQLDVKDIIKFNWENNLNDTEIKTEDIKKLKEKAKLIEKQLRDLII